MPKHRFCTHYFAHTRTDFGEAVFSSNTEVAVILETLKQQKFARSGQRPPECVSVSCGALGALAGMERGDFTGSPPGCARLSVDPLIDLDDRSAVYDAVLLKPLASTTAAGLRVFSKALEYAKAHMGAVQINDPTAIDELFTALKALEWDRPAEEEDGELTRVRLQQYQVGERVGSFLFALESSRQISSGVSASPPSHTHYSPSCLPSLFLPLS